VDTFGDLLHTRSPNPDLMNMRLPRTFVMTAAAAVVVAVFGNSWG
jgi:hypothetical protein